MDLSFSPEEEAFRAEVRAFIAESKPKLPRSTGTPESATRTRDDYMAWHKLLYAKGWVAPHWPKEYGGTGWSVTQRYIFNEECARAEMPPVVVFGLNMLGPVLYTFGSEAQKKHYLPRILSGEDWWCQGYSEPGSGSDLASLRLRAVRQGDHYVVNGQKTWTTLAQYADWIFCLVRTNTEVKAQEGISFLLIDMKSPGITIKPIIVLGGAQEVNEVFFDNVKVPADQLVGEENKGWTYAKFLLVNERTGIANTARSKQAVVRLKEIARAEQDDGVPLIETPEFARKIAELEIELSALEYTELRTLAAEARGEMAGPESSILKIRGTEIQQRITELAEEAVGYYAFPYERGLGANDYVGPDYALGAAGRYFNMRKASIYGGSNEIQRNIIVKAVLGL
ncbi:MAG: acyl-CoA dehydrogenase family protein [Alphaproteobacteria bacterium]|nr:acyl-CoA dehydrogenase family protein [Alphaproteobacteria bacterium]MDE1986997.1 acyl-CoA dehydrogenase family protein [Alphaproteobacteria bacterium]MDE2264287.1 acyl-CoA dehydrogenase family protein [Alphaproteobacteria bacterium]MDE2499152.1 acyl-CoA dehydrogenase family protein [Alphaproteobacteria bacterium]